MSYMATCLSPCVGEGWVGEATGLDGQHPRVSAVA